MDVSEHIPILDEKNELDLSTTQSVMIKGEIEYTNLATDGDSDPKTKNTIPQISIGNSLPASKIRKILKEYDEFSIISKDSLFLITAATVF